MFDFLDHRISPLLAGFPGVVGLVIKAFPGEKSLSINEDEQFPSASLIKLPILWEFFRQVETGQIDATERLTLVETDKVGGSGILKELESGLQLTLRDAATLMIVLSDNTATNMLIDRLGLEAINQTIEALELQRTALQRKLMDYARARQGFDNFTTPADMAKLLALIHDSDRLSANSRQGMLAILKRQQVRTKLPYNLPEEIVLAHKTGEISGCEHDAGILYLPDHTIIVVVLTKQLQDNRDGIELCAKIGKMIYDSSL